MPIRNIRLLLSVGPNICPRARGYLFGLQLADASTAVAPSWFYGGATDGKKIFTRAILFSERDYLTILTFDRNYSAVILSYCCGFVVL